MSLAKNVIVRDDYRAKTYLLSKGIHIPPVYEVSSDATAIMMRQCYMGWVVVPRDAEEKDRIPCGAVVLSSSADGEDWEMIAEGGWYATGAKQMFSYIFNDRKQERVSARCKASNKRNIKVLERFGFVQEGVKRLSGGDVILFGMTKNECKMLGGS
jgi:hypothetical protein